MKTSFTRRSLMRLAAGGLAAPAILRRAAAASETPVLLELFTSQGCSDCPPADKLAGELAKLPGVQLATLNVDYWDYLGWKDTLAKSLYSKRQMDYAHARGDNNVYTPQMVINGATYAVGSRRGDIEAAMAKARASVLPIAVTIAGSGADVEITLGEGPAMDATLWVMGVTPLVSVAIARGENAGHGVIYHNVARQLVAAGRWNYKAQKYKLPKAGLMTPDCTSCLAVLQKGEAGPVLGLASLSI
jgi:hypothetical protein